MATIQSNVGASLNARAGAVALAVCAPLNLVLHALGDPVAPLGYLAWLGLSFGVLCFCAEMGAERPLNRAGLVAFAAAFCADTFILVGVDPDAAARARLLYAFAVLGALVFWSAALMHRAGRVRTVGALGAALGGGGLALLVAAHLLLGTVTIVGFSQLYAAISRPDLAGLVPLLAIDAVAVLWALPAALLLWQGPLRHDA